MITTISIAPLIGEAIKRIHRGESVGALFSSEVEFTQELRLWEAGVARNLDIREPGRPVDGETSSRSDVALAGAGSRRLTAARRAAEEAPDR
jgi:hypothetical protein